MPVIARRPRSTNQKRYDKTHSRGAAKSVSSSDHTPSRDISSTEMRLSMKRVKSLALKDWKSSLIPWTEDIRFAIGTICMLKNDAHKAYNLTWSELDTLPREVLNVTRSPALFKYYSVEDLRWLAKHKSDAGVGESVPSMAGLKGPVTSNVVVTYEKVADEEDEEGVIRGFGLRRKNFRRVITASGQIADGEGSYANYANF